MFQVQSLTENLIMLIGLVGAFSSHFFPSAAELLLLLLMLSDVSSSRPGGADTSRWGIALSSYAVMPLHIWEMEHTDCIEKREIAVGKN